MGVGCVRVDVCKCMWKPVSSSTLSITHFYLPSTGFTKAYGHIGFYMGLGSQIQILMLVTGILSTEPKLHIHRHQTHIHTETPDTHIQIPETHTYTDTRHTYTQTSHTHTHTHLL